MGKYNCYPSMVACTAAVVSNTTFYTSKYDYTLYTDYDKNF
jgi:hypothetical protein